MPNLSWKRPGHLFIPCKTDCLLWAILLVLVVLLGAAVLLLMLKMKGGNGSQADMLNPGIPGLQVYVLAFFVGAHGRDYAWQAGLSEAAPAFSPNPSPSLTHELAHDTMADGFVMWLPVHGLFTRKQRGW